jgi:hypothetical protein
MRTSKQQNRRITWSLVIGLIALVLSMYNFYLIVFKIIKTASNLD